LAFEGSAWPETCKRSTPNTEEAHPFQSTGSVSRLSTEPEDPTEIWSKDSARSTSENVNAVLDQVGAIEDTNPAELLSSGVQEIRPADKAPAVLLDRLSLGSTLPIKTSEVQEDTLSPTSQIPKAGLLLRTSRSTKHRIPKPLEHLHLAQNHAGRYGNDRLLGTKRATPDESQSPVAIITAYTTFEDVYSTLPRLFSADEGHE
jgi:hypothetical protein